MNNQDLPGAPRLSVGRKILVSLAGALAVFLLRGGLPAAAEASKGESLKALVRSGKIKTVVAFGDSVTSGYEAPEGWPEVLGRRLAVACEAVTVINAGRPGDTSGDGLDRLAADVLARNPDLVLVAFGLNDMKKEVPFLVFRSHLESLVERISAAGARVALLTTTRMVMGGTALLHLDPEPYNREIRAVAAAHHVPLRDVFKATAGQNRRKFYRDMVHPNRQGQELLGEIISRALCD
jgi:acyl-CoA thioesterase I